MGYVNQKTDGNVLYYKMLVELCVGKYLLHHACVNCNEHQTSVF